MDMIFVKYCRKGVIKACETTENFSRITEILHICKTLIFSKMITELFIKPYELAQFFTCFLVVVN